MVVMVKAVAVAKATGEETDIFKFERQDISQTSRRLMGAVMWANVAVTRRHRTNNERKRETKKERKRERERAQPYLLSQLTELWVRRRGETSNGSRCPLDWHNGWSHRGEPRSRMRKRLAIRQVSARFTGSHHVESEGCSSMQNAHMIVQSMSKARWG